ncbi:MAG: YraN family protein [Dehalococcoidales bacterium]|nr:YraN family protein [Dehalococcoidales bacterium]
MKLSRKEIGRLGETLVAEYLKKNGFNIIETNYRCHFGEIDIIAQEEDCIVFAEVRTKTSSGFGTPEESVTNTKKKHLIKTAYIYLGEKDKMQADWRIDFIAVELDRNNKPSRIEHYRDAVEG